MLNKELIFKSIIVIGLIGLFSGCVSEDEKKAKDIAVKNIIEEDKRVHEERANKGKSADFRGFSTKAWDK